MLGMIFTELVEMVEDTFSPELADEILTAANLPNGGAYTAVGYYNAEEILSLVTLLSEKTGTPVPDLVQAFGRYLFNSFTRSHAQLLANKHSLFDLLATLDNDIHKEVLKLYSEATLPTFRVMSQSRDCMELEYRSKNHLEPLAIGLIEGAGNYFGHQQLIISQQPDPGSNDATVFRVQI